MGRSLAVVVAALLAGAALPFAYSPYDFYFVAVIALAVLFYLWDTCTPRGAIVSGYCFGIGMFAHGVWWIQVSVHQFGLPLYSFSVAVTAAFVVFMAAYPALAAYLWHKCPVGPRALRLIVIAPAAWVATEALRGSLFTGFPWLLIGYSQTDSPLAAYAPVVGAYGVGLITAALAGACVALAIGSPASRVAALVTGVIVAGGAVSLERIEWTRATGDEVSVALVQGAIPQAVKWRRDYRQPSIDLYTELTRPHWNKALVVWPETAIPAFGDEVPATLEALNTLARDSDTVLLTGIPRVDETDPTRYFNSVIQLGRDTGAYDKRHLVPFGEYLPFDRWLRPLLTFLKIPMSNFSSGADHQAPLTLGRHVLGLSICYEDAYANEVARALPAAGLLVNVSNDAWFGDSIAPHQHQQIARMRALESGRYMLRATNTGISAIIDERGRIIERSEQFKPDVITASVEVRAGVTPATRLPVWTLPGACALLLIAGAVYARQRG